MSQHLSISKSRLRVLYRRLFAARFPRQVLGHVGRTALHAAHAHGSTKDAHAHSSLKHANSSIGKHSGGGGVAEEIPSVISAGNMTPHSGGVSLHGGVARHNTGGTHAHTHTHGGAHPHSRSHGSSKHIHSHAHSSSHLHTHHQGSSGGVDPLPPPGDGSTPHHNHYHRTHTKKSATSHPGDMGLREAGGVGTSGTPGATQLATG